ncbi:hypothetical protein [Pontibacter sp. G13]|uniref:hypothetical protein n=1 Tax=Pontibacter sp. G13 TaxID=3074898 RepID=UPI00288BF707|nr:hypothetical protein [Pontibacter sp. G13]WNJ17524.1 hypothetical protein RJD25_21965 [Pontibacter sp. G13]
MRRIRSILALGMLGVMTIMMFHQAIPHVHASLGELAIFSESHSHSHDHSHVGADHHGHTKSLLDLFLDLHTHSGADDVWKQPVVLGVSVPVIESRLLSAFLQVWLTLPARDLQVKISGADDLPPSITSEPFLRSLILRGPPSLG